MRAAHIATFLLLTVFPVASVSGGERAAQSPGDSNYLVLELEPSASEINLQSLLSKIQLEFKVNGIKFIPGDDGVRTEEFGRRYTDSRGETDGLRQQIYGLERRLRESEDFHTQSLQKIIDQTIVLENKLKEMEALVRKKDIEITALQENQAELTDILSRQSEQLSALSEDKDDLFQYVNKSMSGSNRFIALMFIVLLLLVSIIAFGTIKERFFSRTDRWL